MEELDWELVSETILFVDSLQQFPTEWDLSYGEIGVLSKSLYESILDIKNNGYPVTPHEIENIIERMRVDCWGADHLCGPIPQDERDKFFEFIFNLKSYFNLLSEMNK